MNQTDEEPQVHAHLGVIRIPSRPCCEGREWDEYTPEAASELAGDIAIAIKDARRQLAAIVEACANGHDWSSGYNSTFGDKTTVYSCTREGCEGRKEEPGWLPFEPKQHLVPFRATLADCTGPGCEHCDNESLADHMRRYLVDALPDVGVAIGGRPEPTVTARKYGYQWAVDATPEQLQAAIDAGRER